MAAFQSYQNTVYTMLTKVQHSNDLVNYADGNVLSLANNSVTNLRTNSLAMQGAVKMKANVTGSDPNAKPLPTVTITVCSDTTKFNSYYTYGPKKGQPAGLSAAKPVLSVFVVHKSADGKWRVNSVAPQEGKTCSV